MDQKKRLDQKKKLDQKNHGEQIDHGRRQWLLLGGATLGLSLLSNSALAMLSTPRPRVLLINNLNTGESLTTEYFSGKKYHKSELTRLNYLFRDYRANRIKPIDPRLFEQLFRLQLLLDSRKPIQLVSGYRSISTNRKLRSRSRRVAKRSYHTLGKAMDFYIEGVDLSHIHKAALRLGIGGVGYYPDSNFVHIDTGPVRTW